MIYARYSSDKQTEQSIEGQLYRLLYYGNTADGIVLTNNISNVLYNLY